jgi:hypothetical protein
LGAIDGSSLTVTGDVEGASASLGAIDGSSLTVTGDVEGASASLGAIDGSSLTVTGDVEGASASLGVIDGSSLTVTGDVQGASASLGVIDGTSVVVTGTVQGLNLTSTGTLSAAGITSSAAVNVTGTISATGDIKVDAGNGLRARTGTFGSVETFGDQGSGYNGYSINGDAVFMSNGILYGLFDGAYNDWGVQCTQLGPTTIYYSGIPKLTTALNGVNVTGTISASGAISSAGLNVTGTISATGDITAFSDKRYKDDLVVIESALDKVKQLTGYTYTLHGNRSAGLLAQDVLEVLPEVVKGSEETNYSLAYGNLMGLVVEAIKELDKKVDRILEKHGSS